MKLIQFYTFSEIKALINFIYKLGFYPKRYILSRSQELNISIIDCIDELMQSAMDYEITTEFLIAECYY